MSTDPEPLTPPFGRGVGTKRANERHQWRIEVLYDSHTHRTIEHDSANEQSAIEVLASLILYSKTAQVIKVFKDNEQIRHIEVR